jgi:hypothetical protein
MINSDSGAIITRFVSERQRLSPLNINGTPVSAAAILQALNYGDNPLFSQLDWNWGFRSDVAQYYSLWDEALVMDLSECLFGSSKHQISMSNFVERDQLQGFGERRWAEDEKVVLKALANISILDCSLKIRFPHSYVVASLNLFICFLRERVIPVSVSPEDKGVHDFIDMMTEWWRNVLESQFRTSPSHFRYC